MNLEVPKALKVIGAAAAVASAPLEDANALCGGSHYEANAPWNITMPDKQGVVQVPKDAAPGFSIEYNGKKLIMTGKQEFTLDGIKHSARSGVRCLTNDLSLKPSAQ